MNEDVVVSLEWLAAHREDDDVVVVDVRDAWEYEGIGHVPGAVNIPFDEFRSDGLAGSTDGESDGLAGSTDGESDGLAGSTDGESEDTSGMLPDAEDWRALLESRGVEPSDTVVAYDDTHGVFAARFLVTALVMGHERDGALRFLDGDYSAWTRAHEVTTDATEVTPSVYDVEPPAETPLVDADAVAAAVESDAVVVDTRSAEEYTRAHVPGAVNLDWTTLVDDETRGLKPPEESRSLLAAKGIEPDRAVVLYCNTARRISHTYVVLRWLGFTDVAFFEGSMRVWEREGRPTAAGG